MQCAETHNSTWAAAVRAAARQGRLSHALILTGEGDKRSAARYIAAAHLCRSDAQRPCLQCNACRKVMAGIHPDVAAGGNRPRPAAGCLHPPQRG